MRNAQPQFEMLHSVGERRMRKAHSTAAEEWRCNTPGSVARRPRHTKLTPTDGVMLRRAGGG